MALAQSPTVSFPNVVARDSSVDNRIELSFSDGGFGVARFEVQTEAVASGPFNNIRYQVFNPGTGSWQACPATFDSGGARRACSVNGSPATLTASLESLSAAPLASTDANLFRIVYDVVANPPTGGVFRIGFANSSFLGSTGSALAGTTTGGSIKVHKFGSSAAAVAASEGRFNAPSTNNPVEAVFFAGDDVDFVRYTLRFNNPGRSANRRFQIHDPSAGSWIPCPAMVSAAGITRSCSTVQGDQATYEINGSNVALPNLTGVARALFDVGIASPEFIDVSFDNRTFRRVGGGSSNATSFPASIEVNAFAPTLSYSPAEGTAISFASGLAGTAVTTSIAVALADFGILPGQRAINCVTAAPFAIAAGGNQTIKTDGLTAEMKIACSLQAAAANGTLTCTEGANLNGPPRTRTWPLGCPPASQAPALVYTPAPSLIGFGTGIVGANVTQGISIAANGGANQGAVTLACATTGAGFSVSPPSVAIAVGATPNPLIVTCARTASLRSGQLDCTESDAPGGATRSRSWPLQCAAGDLAPVLAYGVAPGQTISLPVGLQGTTSATTLGITASGGANAGSAGLLCNASAGFALNNATQAIAVGTTPPDLGISCNLGVQALDGSLSCTETDTPGGATRQRNWPLACPAGTPAPVAPTLEYSPPGDFTVPPSPIPNVEVRLSDGPLTGTGVATIGVSASGGVTTGTVSRSCASDNPAAIQITQGASQSLAVGDTAADIRLACTRTASDQIARLTCTESPSPGTSRSGSWRVLCPAGTAGLLRIGRATGTRQSQVTVPVTFLGANDVRSVEATLTYPAASLTLVSATAANGATCTAGNGSVFFSRSSGLALPQVDTTYCTLTFSISALAPLGEAALGISGTSPTCFTTTGAAASPPCSFGAGVVSIAAFDSLPAPGSTLSLVAVQGQAIVSRAIRVLNSGTSALSIDCTLPAGQPTFTLAKPQPLNVAGDGDATIEINCQPPPLGDPVAVSTLTCTVTGDAAFSTPVRYGLTCRTIAGATPGDSIPTDADAGDELGTGVATRVNALGNEITVVGAPNAGADGAGRVYILERQPLPLAKRATDGFAFHGHAIDLSDAKSITGVTPAIGDKFGASVAISNDGRWVAVGAPFAGTGRVEVYSRPAGGWGEFDATVPTTRQVLDAPVALGTVTPSEFGAQLEFADDGTLIVGAPASQVGNQPGAGAVVGYSFNASNVPAFALQQAAMLPPNPTASAGFGSDVDAANGMIVIGAPGENVFDGNSTAMEAGAAYAMTAGTSAVRLPNTGVTGDKFGQSVAIANGMAVVGAPGRDTNGIDNGGATVFRGNTPLTLVPVSTLVPELAAAGDAGDRQRAGTAIAVSDDTIVLGAPFGGSRREGSALLYDLGVNLAATARADAVLENPGGEGTDGFAGGDQFARSVAIDTRRVLIGVPFDDNELAQGQALQEDQGRADPFVLDRILRAGFE